MKFCSLSCVLCWSPQMQGRTGMNSPCPLKFNQGLQHYMHISWIFIPAEKCDTTCSLLCHSLGWQRWGSVPQLGPGGLGVENVHLHDRVEHDLSIDLLRMWKEAFLFLLWGWFSVAYNIKQLCICSFLCLTGAKEASLVGSFKITFLHHSLYNREEKKANVMHVLYTYVCSCLFLE